MRHMSLCTGYGGIDLALEAVLGARTVAVADIDPGAIKILNHRYPGTPNLGDITTTNWSRWVGRVDVISGGTPCQDLSNAGRRAGMTEGTRSNLWVAMREAIATIRPALVVWENVRGAYSAAADSEVEPCTGCVGDPINGTLLRALGRVLGDLSSLGYDTCWYGLRASDVGAAHHRFRVFVFAWPANTASDTWRLINRNRGLAHDADDAARYREWSRTQPGQGSTTPDRLMPTPTVTARDNRSASPGAAFRPSLEHLVPMLPTPKTTDDHHSSPADLNRNAPGLRSIGQVLPTPSAYSAERGGSQDPAKRRAGGHSVYLDDVAAFLPTTRAGDGTKGGPNQRGSSGDLMLPSAVQDWREYEPAIRRQEAAFGRPAPLPTEPGKTGKPRLSARFSEWLMGLPDGWITDTPGIARNEALKATGNGVVPQQCAAAVQQFVRDFTSLFEAAA